MAAIFLGVSCLLSVAPASAQDPRSLSPQALAELLETTTPRGGLKLIRPEKALGLLYLLIDLDRPDLLERAVRGGVDPDVRVPDTAPALHYAVSLGATRMVRALLAAGADPDTAFDGIRTADLARLRGDPEMLTLFRLPASDIEMAILLEAMRSDDLQLLARTARGGMDLNVTGPDGNTPLLLAVAEGSVAAVRLLLELGAHPGVSSADDVPPVVVAVMLNRADVLRVLLENDADLPEMHEGVPLLSLAAFSGGETIDALIAAGIDPGIADTDGIKPGDVARAVGLIAVAEKLEEAARGPADIDLRAAIRAGDKAALEAAGSAGVDFDQVNSAGVPLLLEAAGTAPDGATLAAIARGADNPLATDQNGETALDVILGRRKGDAPDPAIPDMLYGLSLAISAAELRSMLTLEGRDGVSGLGKIALFVPVGQEARRDYRAFAAAGRRLANQVDSTGRTPLQAAVIADNADFIAAMGEHVSTGVEGPPTLQDLARANKSWQAFAALPTDRRIPEEFRHGLYNNGRLRLQRMLNDTGYYSGTVDGKFGPASRAALDRMIRDQIADMRAMNKAGVIAFSANVLRHQSHRHWCTWTFVDYGETSRYQDYLGCVVGSAEFPGKGIGVLRKNGSVVETFITTGGWKDRLPL
ncbi:ankyrin repeat domain-containing protein [Oricola sp.]|uniref:ankyrin repeat domain-containing protein n=1 Tax=Oricola sp. TaxID=1979950 RepID=UPI003BA9E85E